MNNEIPLIEKLIFQRARRAAIVWILALRMDPKPLTETLAADILQITPKSARGYFHTLQELGIITRLGRFKGYQLTRSGKQLSLPLELRRLQEQATGKIYRSDPVNVNEEEDSLKDLNTSLLTLSDDRSILPDDRSILPVEPNFLEIVDKSAETVDNLGITPPENDGISIDELVKQLIDANPEKQAILDELLFCRIQMNWKTFPLLLSESLTVEEIKAQFVFLQDKGLEYSTGILITNLLSEYRPRGAEFDPDTGHTLDCECWRCVGARNKRFFEDWEK